MDAEPFPLFDDADDEADWFDEYLGFLEREQPTELPVKTYERISK
jgi:hypothetical protein